jgi:putative transposase
MPNHVHAIVMILTPRRDGVTPALHEDLAPGDIIGFYKYQTTLQINTLTNTPVIRSWQRNYYDHIIRNGVDLNHHRKYILENPLRREHDQYYIVT